VLSSSEDNSFEDNDYRKQSCIMVETYQATIPGRTRFSPKRLPASDSNLMLPPTRYYPEADLRNGNYELKVSREAKIIGLGNAPSD